MPGLKIRILSSAITLTLAFLLGGCGGGSNTVSPNSQASPSTTEQWTWWQGSDLSGAQGRYGAQGKASSTNGPGARQSAASWTDANGRLWMFGGNGLDASGDGGLLNDMWVFDPVARDWTWEGGANIQGAIGVYGAAGTASPASTPGGRQNAATWRDASGKLWLFGGKGFDSAGNVGLLNDLWMFDPSSATWTWIGGSNLANAQGNYGKLRASSSDDTPGGRQSAVAWVDAAGSFWLFGGSGIASTAGSEGLLNDLWRFEPSTHIWTWMSGSDQPGSYGNYGSALYAPATGSPGARESASGWSDRAGNLWLFGGTGNDSAVVLPTDPLPTVGLLNDLWEYTPKTNTWLWVTGSYLTAATGSYGTMGISSSGNTPGARAGAAAWSDGSGSLWLFGGSYFNDVWVFNPGGGTWMWAGGSDVADAPGDYGSMGISAASNVPGGRMQAATWVDGNGVFWLFGGNGYDSTGLNEVNPQVFPELLNDVWAYRP